MDIYVLRITLGDWSAVHTYTEAEAAQEGAEDWLQKNAYPTGLVWKKRVFVFMQKRCYGKD